MSSLSANQAVRAGSFVGSVTGQAVAWNKVHNTNKRSGYGFFHRMGRHAGYNIVGGVAGSVGGSALAGLGYAGLKMLRK